MATGTLPKGAGAHHTRTTATGVSPFAQDTGAAATGWAPGLPPAPMPIAPVIDSPDVLPLDPAALDLPAPTFVLGSMLAMATTAASSTAPRQTDDNSDIAVRGPQARAKYGVTGSGIRIGILSDSFNLLGGMAADQASGNLPASVTILKDGPAGSHDEGRAMADLIHRIAPGASIDFYSATISQTGFAAGIAALTAAGCNIIVDDVAYLNEPFFQDGGAVQAAVESAVAQGVSYFTAASNEGTDYVQQAFRATHATLPGLPANAVVQNFAASGAAQPSLAVSVPTGGTLILDMQWDQPFASIGSGHSSANSLGLALYSLSGQLLAAGSVNCVGGNPDQTLTFDNTTSSTSFRLVVWQNGGSTPPGLFKIINYGNGSISGGGSGSGTVIGQEMVPGANTVGAVAWSNTTAFGGNNAAEPYSSVGTGDILFNAAGQRLATPQSTAKVNFTAPDGSITSVFAPFYGTSAAAPDAAAVAALALQANPHLTPAQVTSVLEQSAAPAGGGGASAIGYGLVQADSAVALALSLAHGGH